MANRKKEEYPLSRPSMTVQAVLSSTSAHKLFKQNFEAVSNHLYNITKMTRIVGNDDAADKAEAEIKKIFDACQQDLEGEIARLQKMLSDNSIAGAPSYEVTKEYDVKITTNYASVFLSLIQTEDKVNSLIDTVQIVGIINTKQQMAGIYRYEKRVRKAANQIREMGNILKAYAHAQSSGQDIKGVEAKMHRKLNSETDKKTASVAA